MQTDLTYSWMQCCSSSAADTFCWSVPLGRSTGSGGTAACWSGRVALQSIETVYAWESTLHRQRLCTEKIIAVLPSQDGWHHLRALNAALCVLGACWWLHIFSSFFFFSQALACLVLMASVRRSLFTVPERGKFLESMLKGVQSILESPQVRTSCWCCLIETWATFFWGGGGGGVRPSPALTERRDTCVHACMHTRVYAHTHTRARTLACTHAHMHTCMHNGAQSWFSKALLFSPRT